MKNKCAIWRFMDLSGACGCYRSWGDEYEFNGLYEYGIFNDIMKVIWEEGNGVWTPSHGWAGPPMRTQGGFYEVDGWGVFDISDFFLSSNVLLA